MWYAVYSLFNMPHINMSPRRLRLVMSALAHPRMSQAVIDFPAAELTKEFFGTAK